MSRPSLILIGAGGHARSCIDVIEQQGQFRIAGLVGLVEQKHATQLGYSVIASDDELPSLVNTYSYALITVGHIKSADQRIRLFQKVRQLGFEMPVIISPTAHVSRHASIDTGTIVMHGAIINAGAKVGSNCIVNSRALVEHDTTVEDHCHIATGAILNGDVTVGAGSFIGSGSAIKQGVKIGARCLVGMGVTVRHDLSDHAHFMGHDKA